MSEKQKQRTGWMTRTAPGEVVQVLQEALETILGEEIGGAATAGSIHEAVERFRLTPTYPKCVEDMASALNLAGAPTYSVCLTEVGKLRKSLYDAHMALSGDAQKKDAERIQLTGALGMDPKTPWGELLAQVAALATYAPPKSAEPPDPDRVIQRPIVDGVRARILRDALIALRRTLPSDGAHYARAEAVIFADDTIRRWNGQGAST